MDSSWEHAPLAGIWPHFLNFRMDANSDDMLGYRAGRVFSFASHWWKTWFLEKPYACQL